MRYKIIRRETNRWAGDILDPLHDLSITWGTGHRSRFKPVSVLSEFEERDEAGQVTRYVFYVLCEEVPEGA